MATKPLRLGRGARLSKTLTADDIHAFANAVRAEVRYFESCAVASRIIDDASIAAFGAACGDLNKVHFDDQFASQTRFKGRIAHGMLTAGLIPQVVGKGDVRAQHIKFVRPVRPGDKITARAKVTNVSPTGITRLDTVCVNEQDKPVITGYVDVVYDAHHELALEQAAASPCFDHLNGLLAAGLVSAVLGTKLPGDGTIYLEQHLVLQRSPAVGEMVTGGVRVEKMPGEDKLVNLATFCLDEANEPISTGYAVVMFDPPVLSTAA